MSGSGNKVVKGDKPAIHGIGVFEDKQFFFDLRNKRWELEKLRDVYIIMETEFYAKFVRGRTRISKTVYKQLKRYLDAKTITD